MAFEQRHNSGALFPNDRKEKETHPDFKGDFNIDGVNFWISAWRKDGKRGEFFSLSVEKKKAPDVSSQVDGKPRTKGDEYRAARDASHKPSAPPMDDFPDDSIPFS